jgi:phage gp36-like protein
MAYASIDDMVLRFGQSEIARASTPDGQEVGDVVAAPVQAALNDASATADSYLRKRYQTPLDIAPVEITRTVCSIARVYLLSGGGRQASEQALHDQKEAVSWLERIARGLVLLDLQEVAQGDESFAVMEDRRDVFSGRNDGNSFRGGFW